MNAHSFLSLTALAAFTVVVAGAATGCGSSSSGSSGSSGSYSSGTSGSSGVAPKCRKNNKTDRCECTVGSQSLDDDWDEVSSCDSAPYGATICATVSSGNEAESCYYEVAHCGSVNRDYTSCECGFSSDLVANEVSSCSARTCCDFGDTCSCSSITGASLENTKFADACTGANGKVVSSCSPSTPKRACPGGMKTVSSCAGLTWKAPSTGGSSSSSGSSSEGCTGCHANSDCGSCERCELSTCSCLARSVCR